MCWLSHHNCFSKHVSFSSSSGYPRFCCWCFNCSSTSLNVIVFISSTVLSIHSIELHIAPSIHRLKFVMSKKVQTADDAIVRTGLHVGITELNMLCVKQWDQWGTIKLRWHSFHKLKWVRRNLRTLPIYGHLSRVLISHHFTFLWGSPPMFSSNWLRSGPYGTMYCVSVQCNACTYYSLFVWLLVLIKPKPNIYMRE